MNKWLKRTLAMLASLLVVLILAVLALPFVIDPSSFKGPLERVAAGRNVHLSLEGPISWQFYPQLGLSLENVVIAPLEQPDTPLARADGGTAAVALMPLFSGRVAVDEVVLNGVAVSLIIDEQGEGNWEGLGGQDESEETPTEEAPEEGREPLDVSVQRIAINNASLDYENRQAGQTARLQDLSVELSDVNLENRLFPLAISAKLSHSSLPNPLQIRFDGQLQANGALDQFAVEEGELRASVPDSANAELSSTLAGRINLESDLSYQGQVAVEPFNAKALLAALGQPLPETADPEALTNLAFAAGVTGTDQGLGSDDLVLTLDDTRVTGNAAVALNETGAPTANLELAGNSINVDRYMAPAAEENAPAANGGDSTPAPSGDTALPLDTLRGINLDLSLEMDEIIAMDMPITQARLAVQGEEGFWQLTDLSADFYQGKLSSEGQLDARPARGDTAAVEFSADMDQLSLQPLLVDFADFGDLSGTVSGELQSRTRAATSDELLENLSAAFAFTSPELTFQGINAEYFYCQMGTQLGDGEMPDTEWPSRTRITEVEGQLTFDESRLTIANLIAYVENLVLTASGYLDLGAMDYRVRLPMRLAQQQTSESGCLIESNFLQNREVDVLGCDGSLEALDFGEQCGLDSGAVGDLAKQAVRYNVQKRADEKKEEVREELREKLRERLGDEDGEEEENGARDLLRDLLNR